jgi:hypothetical protein
MEKEFMIRSKKLWLIAPLALASASIDATAVAAAHRILVNYFPAQQAVNSQAAASPCNRRTL